MSKQDDFEVIFKGAEMVYYSLDTKIRITVCGILGILSTLPGIVLSLLVKGSGNNAVTSLLSDIEPSVIYSLAPSVFAIFASIYVIFDHWIWRISGIRKLLGVPDFRGTWIGTLTAGDQANAVETEVHLKITQTWSRIGLKFIGNTSQSTAISAYISIENREDVKLIWTYNSVPIGGGVVDPDKYGEGTTTFDTISITDKKMEGRYYSSKLRKGSLVFQKNEVL